jgi:hypothetical protein
MTTGGDSAHRCAWCGTDARSDEMTCSSCGAALAQREDIGGVVIPGVTDVDPALQGLADRPMRIPGASPSQGMAGGMAVAAAIGGPVALAAIGGFAAVAAAEYIGAKRPDGAAAPDAAHVGELSELARQALARLERGEVPERGDQTGPRPDTAETTESGSPHLADPWRDLPKPANDDAAGSDADPWRDLPSPADRS